MDARWLKTQFDLYPDKSKAGLADAMGLEPPAVSKILGGKRQIKAHEYLSMRKYFGLPLDGGRAVRRSADSFVIDSLTVTSGMQDNADVTGAEQWVVPASIFSTRTKAPADQIKVFKVQENTMAPEFSFGEHVVVDLTDKKPSPPGVFVISDGFGHLVRRCEFVTNSKPAKVRISAIDKNFQTQVLDFTEFKIVGRVIARLQWL
jgi:hypothetical protein